MPVGGYISGATRPWYLDPGRHLLSAVLALVIAFGLVVAPLPWTPGQPAAYAAHEEFCFLVADSGNTLTTYDRLAGTETIVGPLGASNVEAIALNQATGVLYGANASTLGTINTTTGAYSSLGSFGSGDGPDGTVTFFDIDGLAFDAATGILWGSQFSSSTNYLVQIDTSNGDIIAGAFGGDDYLVVSGASHLDDIAFDPTTGILYASDSPGGGDDLVTIDTTTGVATVVGSMGTDDMEGLSVDPSGNLLGTNGSPSELYSVSKTTGSATFEANLGPGTLGDYEAAACQTQYYEVADLELTKSVNNATPVSGETVTFTITVENVGEHDVSGVEVTDVLPAGLTYDSDDSGGSYNSGSGVWTVGTIADGGSATINIDVVVPASGTFDNIAEVTAADLRDPDSTPDNGVAAEDDQDNAQLVVQPTSIDLVKTLLSNADEDGSGDVTLNDTLTYQFVATNTGTVNLTNVAVADPLPGLSAISCSPAQGSTLGPSASMTCTATYSVTQADVDAGSIDNTATATGTPPTGPDVTDDSSVSTPVPQTAAIGLDKFLRANADEDGSGDVSLNDTLTYQFVATNNGTVTLSAVVISDPLPGLSALSCSPTAPATLAPGASMTCTATYSVTQADVDNGAIDNTATVNATDPGGAPLSDDDSEQVPIPQSPAISFDKSLQGNADEDGSGDVSVGDTLTYQFVVNNDGDVTLTSVGVSDPLPGLSAISCSPAQGSSLAPGASMTCTATYSVTQADADAGSIDNTATASGTPPTGPPLTIDDSETVPVPPAPSVDLVKSLLSNADEDGSGDVSLSDTLTYEFVATNDGNQTLSGVTITDPLPGLSALTCSPAAGSSLAPTESMTCTATYTVTQGDVDAGSILNTATVDATDPDGDPVDDTDDESVLTGQTVAIALVKSLFSNADEDGSGTVSLNDTLTYSFVVSNDGTVTLDGVTVTDPLPGLSALTCAPATGSSLAPGATMTCTATYSVTQADVDVGSIDNTATVDATDPGGNPVDDTDDETVLVPQTALVSLDKTLFANADEDGSGDVSLNDTLTYQFVATNDGNVTLSNVTITDPLPGLSALTCVPVAGSSLAPTATMTCTATYTVTQADVDLGSIDNTATVNATDPAGNPLDDTDAVTVPVAQVPSIDLVKSLFSNADEDGSGSVSLNDTLTYSFVASNDGTVTLDGVTVTDPLPGLSALACTPATGSTLAPSESMACTATYVVTQADVDAGSIDNTATVDATDPDGNPVDDTDDETVPVPQTPLISLVKSLLSNADEDGSGDVSLNDTLTYQFVATNGGNVTLDGAIVTDPLPGLSAITCSPAQGATLAPTESMTCTATYVVAQADVDAGSIVNTATVDATDPDGNPVDDTDDETVPTGQIVSIELIKSLFSNADEDGSGTVSLNDTLTYSFVATNDGSVTLNNVTVTDPLPGLSALTCAPVAGSSLAPTEAMTCSATYTVTQADVDSGSIDNTATVDATDPGGNPVDDTDTETVPITRSASIALVKSLQSNADEDASGTVTVGDTLTYSFVATNDGNVTLDGVTVTDPLPGLSALTCSPAAGSSLAPTETMTCTATYSVSQGDIDAGAINNTATVNGTDPDGGPVDDTDNETVVPPQSPSIDLVKSLQSNADEDGSGDISLGDTLTYAFDVTNDGNVTLANVTVTDPLPGLSAISCTPAQGSSLAPTGTMSCTATYSVTQADVDAGIITNTATATGTPPVGPNVTDDDTVMLPPPQAASVDLVKSLQSNADEDSSGTVSVGDTLTYSFVGTNDGNVTLSNVAITDPLPGLSALTCVPAAGSSLAPGASMTCTATYSVSQGDIDSGAINNTATVDGTDPAGNPVSDSDMETVVPPQNPSIVLVKSLQSNADEDASGDVTLGDTLTYSFVATNDGDVTLSLAEITDPLPGLSALTCSPAAGSSLAPTESMTCTATYSVTQADVDAGQVDNTATVTSERPGGDPGDPADDITDDDSESVTVVQAASIDLVKSLQSNADEDGSGSVTFNDTLTYSFVATNDGSVTLDNVVISDPLPGLSALTCAPVAGSSLAPTESMTCTATYVVAQADVDAGSVFNTATADATDPGGNPVDDPDDETVPVEQTPSIDLVKSLQSNADEDGSGSVTLNDTLTYSFVATNDGTVTLDNVAITDPLPGLSALTCTPVAGSTLAPTESMTCTATYVVTQADVDAGEILNTATVDSTDPDGNPVDDTDDETVPITRTPSIVLTKNLLANADEDGSGNITLGDTLTYQFIATNDGDVTLDNVVISDPLPGLSVLTCAPLAGASLAPTESMTCTATYSVTQADVDSGTIVNTATVDSTDPDGDPVDDTDDNTANVSQTPSIALVKSLQSNADEDASGTVTLNDTLTYSFVATNDGTVTLDNVAITDPLPGLSALTCSPAAGSSLAPTESMTCTATYVVAQADVDAGSVFNTATADATDPGGNPVDDPDDETVPVEQTPSIDLVKSLQSNADEDGSGTVTLNDTLTYSFVATNDGTVTLDNVAITDPLPGLSALTCTPVAGSSLAPTEAMTCTATYSVTLADMDAGSIFNTATVDATDPGGNPVDDSDDETVPAEQTPSIDLVKALQSNADEDGSGTVTLNDTLTYSFVATNDGTVTLDNVAITDPLPGLSALTCSPTAGSSLAPTESMVCTATYVVTQADVDTGSVFNTATADATDPGGNPVDDPDDETVPVEQTPSIDLVKSLQSNADEDGSGTVTLNDTLTYSFVATNDGTVTLDNVTITDPLPGLSALTCSPAAGSSLAPTESMTCTATYSVTLADSDAGSIFNSAIADATDPGGNPVDDPDDETVPVEQTPSIVLVKSLQSNADEDGSGDVSLNDTLTYGFVATNNGTVTLDNVAITDPLPGLSALTCAPVAGSSLAPTETMTCTATYSVVQADVDTGEILNTATVNATDPGGNPVDDTDDETVVIGTNPSIALTKNLLANADEDGSGNITLGDTLTYQFIATNDGTVTLDNVTITDPLPGLSALTCTPLAGASLAPTESMTCTATYSVTQADVDAGTIVNTATVDSTDPDGNPVDDTDDNTANVTQTPSIDLVKSLQSNADEDASGTVTLNDTLTYSFVATNDGTVTLDNVAITDPLPGLSALTCAPVAGSSLAPTESMTCTATYVVAQADVDAGSVFNTATADATDPGGNPVDDPDDETVPVEQSPSIDLVKALQSNADEDGSGTVTLNDTLTYSFVATNDGTVTLDNVTISDPLPGLSALTCVPVAGSSLAPTESMTCTATYVVTQADVDAGSVFNTATADATDPNGNPVDDPDDETVPVEQTPSIDLVKSLQSNADEDGSGDVSLNDTLTYSFVATNDGTVTLDNVAITDPLPGLSALTCAPVAGSSLAPTESMTCTATYSVVQADVDAGSILNTATVNATDPGGNPLDDTDDETVIVGVNPSIALVKALQSNADEDGSGDVSLNDTLTYSFVATNDGTVTLDNVVVTDPLPGLSALTCAPIAGSSLAPTESMTCTATYSVTQADVDAGQVDNTATVTGTDPGGNPVDDMDDETVPVAQVASIVLVKTLQSNADEDGSGDVTVGDTLTYSFVATNDGIVTLSNVAITDPLPGLGILVCTPATTLAPTETLSCTATYTVTQADADNGQIDNTATVNGTDPGGNPVDDTDDETVPVAQNPVIGLAKDVSSVINNGDGTYTVSFLLTMENLGDVTLSDVVLTDDIVGQFAGLAPTGFTASDGSLTASGAWDGSAASNILAAGQSLAPGQIGDVTITFTVTPGSVTSVDNNADVSATTPGGGNVDDMSTAGVDPDPNDDDTPDEEDPTPVSFVEAPLIGLAKTVTTGPTSNGDGTYDVTYELLVSNLGDTDLLDVQVTDDMAATYAAATGFSVLSTSSADFTVNASYDGSGDVNLLDGTDTLPIGASGTVQITVQVTPGAFLGPYDNTATATGTSPGGIGVTDDSQDGVDVDPDGNGNPGDNSDPTPVSFPSQEFDLTVVKTGPGEVNDGDTATWSIVVTNLGPGVAPGPIVVTDDMPVQLTYVSATGAGWACAEGGNVVICTRASDLAAGQSSSITLETVVSGEEGDEITNLVEVESQGGLVETVVNNNDDDATLVVGVLPATGRNLGTFAWFGLLMLLAGIFLILGAQRRADRLWVEHGIRA